MMPHADVQTCLPK